MSLHINVPDGTGAGKRRIVDPGPWYCKCVKVRGVRTIYEEGGPCDVYDPSRDTFKRQPGGRYSCDVCGERRPT